MLISIIYSPCLKVIKRLHPSCLILFAVIVTRYITVLFCGYDQRECKIRTFVVVRGH